MKPTVTLPLSYPPLTIVVLHLLVVAAPALAQDHYPLEILVPKGVGAPGPGLDADSPVYFAHTGLAYNIQATARGGEWPYTYRLTNAPPGMTIEAGPCATNGPTCTAGTINWPSPSGDHTPTVTVTDRDGDTATATWTITTSTCRPGTAGCCVVDGDVADDSGAGTVASPWKTLAHAYNHCGARSRLFILEAATAYDTRGLTPAKEDCFPGRIQFSESRGPVVWLGRYTTAKPTIDLSGGGTSASCLRKSGKNIWTDNLRFRHGPNITLQYVRMGGYGSVARRLDFETLGPGTPSQNPAAIMYFAGPPSYGDIVQNVTATDIKYGAGLVLIKGYHATAAVWENNAVSNIHSRTGEREGPFAIKASMRDVTVRNNSCRNFPAEVPCVSGNFAAKSSAEIHHNLMNLPGGDAMHLGVNRIDGLGPIFVHHNTIRGAWLIANLQAGDGPITATRNVTINAGGRGSPACSGLRADCNSAGGAVVDYSTIVDKGNHLTGAEGSGLVDADGVLRGASLPSHGPASATSKGHMLGSGQRTP
jgi:hypothetical protein